MNRSRLMAQPSVDDRITELERRFSRQIAELEVKVSDLSGQVGTTSPSAYTAWWKKIVGIYQDDPEFDEAMRLGREYRESLRPTGDEEAI
jgi:hypothetical protein